MQFDLKTFIQTNELLIDDEQQLACVQEAIKQNQPVGFVSKGPIEGMIPGCLAAIGTNAIFDEGICVSLYRDEAAKKHTLYLLPQVVCVCIAQLPDDVHGMLEQAKMFMRELGMDERCLGFLTTLEESPVSQEANRALLDMGIKLQTFTELEAKGAVEELSEIDKLIGKTPSDTISECLARLCGTQLTKETEHGFTLAQTEWKISFNR